MTVTPTTPPLRVLIVEDEPDDADLVVRELRRAGLPAEPRRVMTAAELRSALAEGEWDLVLADYQLPQFSAPAALRVLQSTGHDLPFIVVSGTVGEETAVEVLRAGAHDFMVKGKLARLGPAVQRELREAQERAERRQMEAARRLADQERAESLVREQAARAEAEAALRTRDEFLSIASHELRTPVASVKAAAQLLLRWQNRGALNEERLETSLQDLERSASRLAQLTEDLLDVGRLQDGRLPLRPVDVDLGKMVSHIVERYRAQLPESHALKLDVPRRRCCIIADPDRIEQVVTNLLENAVKYSPSGGTVATKVRTQRGGVLVSVSDNGIGLPPEANELIFEPFGRALNSLARQLPGMGLGLYICRQIVEAHAGRIWADSSGENQGTTMHLWLPRST